MPSVPKRPCAQVGCRHLTDSRYCEDHQYKKAEHSRHYDKQVRDKQAATFYHSVEWQRAREQVLMRDHYLCRHCLKKKRITSADMIHHEKTVKLFWHLRLRLENLISLCNSCHAKVDHKKLENHGAM